MGAPAADADKLETLIAIGMALSRGRSFPALFRRILAAAQNAANAEGGSLYIVDEKNRALKIVVLINDRLGMEKVVHDFDPLDIQGVIDVPLYDESGASKMRTVSVSACLNRKTVLIHDVYAEAEYDLGQVRKFDEANGYRTRAMLAVPLFAHDQRVIGVVQLINGRADDDSADLSPAQVRYIEALSAQMGMVLNNAILVAETENLLMSVVKMIGVAIDEKSPHTSGHCQRVTELTMMFAEAAADEREGPLADFTMTDADRRELRMAALLHDVGKIITPAHVLDKRTKLQAITDRIELIRARFAALRVAAELEEIKRRVRAAGRDDLLADDGGGGTLEAFEETTRAELAFLDTCNRGELFVDDKALGRINEIAARTVAAGGEEFAAILPEERDYLAIKRGTLSPQERKIMEEHVSISIRLLRSLPWPKDLRRVTEYAGGHHENVNGTGYPYGLTGAQMPVPARILAIADRFEGISAPDRPYKSAMKLSKVMAIMRAMRDDDEIDRDLFEVFVNRKIYLDYARRHMAEELIDCD